MSDSQGDETTLLFADIGSSVKLYQEVGDVEGHRTVSESLQKMAQSITQHGGVVLRTVGDATLARFDHPDSAVQAAIAIQHAHESSPLSVRVGFHCGRVIEDKGDVYGNAVNIAARIASFARVNEITTSGETVHRLGHDFANQATLLRQSKVRGVSDLISIYRIDWQAEIDAATRIATRVGTVQELRATQSVHQLVVSFGGKQWVLGAARTSLRIGRTELSDICVATDRASRDHAVIEYHEGQFLLTDTSTNGSFIQKNGQPVFIVQRETVVLDGRGTLGVGIEPCDPTAVSSNVANGSTESERATIRFAVEFA